MPCWWEGGVVNPWEPPAGPPLPPARPGAGAASVTGPRPLGSISCSASPFPPPAAPMAWRAAAAPLLLGHLSLLPRPLSGAGAEAGQGFELQQPDKVSVTVGETLTLTCTVFGSGSPGAVKWLKGRSGGNETVYDQKGSFPRVTRVVDGSNTDFSIRIWDVRPEDAGTYYCVKFIKWLGNDDELFRSGKGTEVSVHETSLVPSMVAAAVVLCFLLLLGFFIALCMYRRKRRGEAGSLAGLVATGSFLPTPLQCCAGTPGTPSKVPGEETLHLPSQQSSKEDNDIHYADLQTLPAAPWHGKSPGAACSEYASIQVAAK